MLPPNKVFEEGSENLIFWCILIFHHAHRHQIGLKPFGQILAEVRKRVLALLLVQQLMLLLAVLFLHALPRELSLNQIHGHVADRLHVVSPALREPVMRVSRGVPGGAYKPLVPMHGDVFTILIKIPQTEPEIDQVNLVQVLASEAEIIGLDIAVDDLQ